MKRIKGSWSVGATEKLQQHGISNTVVTFCKRQWQCCVVHHGFMTYWNLVVTAKMVMVMETAGQIFALTFYQCWWHLFPIHLATSKSLTHLHAYRSIYIRAYIHMYVCPRMRLLVSTCTCIYNSYHDTVCMIRFAYFLCEQSYIKVWLQIQYRSLG